MKKLLTLLMMMCLCATSALAIEVTVNNYDPSPAEAGKFVNVWFKIENTDTSKTGEMSVQLIPKDGLSLSSGENAVKRVGILGALVSETVQYRLFVDDRAVEGPNMVEVIVSEQGKTGQIDFDLPIEVVDKDFKEVDLEVGNLRSDPVRIKPGDERVELRVTLQNLGDTTAKGVRARLDNLPAGMTFTESYSDLELMGNIDGDGTAIATYVVDVEESVEPKEYNARLYVDYKFKEDEDEDDYTSTTDVLPVRVSVKAVPLYEISDVTFEPETLRAGDKNVKMKMTITNVGKEEGESVRVKVYGKSEQPITYDVSSNFVAPELKPGESGEATIEFDIDSDANVQQYLLDVEIKNLIDDDIITYDKTIPLEVSLPAAQTPWGLIAIVVIVILIGAGVMRARAKRKEKRKSPKRVKLD